MKGRGGAWSGDGQVYVQVGIAEGAKRGHAHGAMEFILGIEEPRGIEEDHLASGIGANADDAVPCALGFG